jgi:hypothetical protein
MWSYLDPNLVLSPRPLVTEFQKRLLRTLLVGVAIFALSHAVDGWAFRHLVYRDVYDRDWGRMLRVMGFLPLWGLAALALILQDWRDHARRWRGFLIFAAPTVGGLLCEVLKLLIRREGALMSLPTPFHVYRRLNRVHDSLRQALTTPTDRERKPTSAAHAPRAVQYR